MNAIKGQILWVFNDKSRDMLICARFMVLNPLLSELLDFRISEPRSLDLIGELSKYPILEKYSLFLNLIGQWIFTPAFF